MKLSVKVKAIWHNAAKGPYKWHHTLMMQDFMGHLYVWTYTDSGGSGSRYPDGFFTIKGDRDGETQVLKKGQMLTRLTRCKVEA